MFYLFKNMVTMYFYSLDSLFFLRGPIFSSAPGASTGLNPPLVKRLNIDYNNMLEPIKVL